MPSRRENHRCRRVAIDSVLLRANGGVWHQKDRAKGEVSHSAIDTETQWAKSGWHGWVYGWNLHLISVAVAGWIPLVAYLTAVSIYGRNCATSFEQLCANDFRQQCATRRTDAKAKWREI